jgi:hypothetical protein
MGMNTSELTALLDRLRAEPRETEWLAFKANQRKPKRTKARNQRRQNERPYTRAFSLVFRVRIKQKNEAKSKAPKQAIVSLALIANGLPLLTDDWL